MYSSSSKPIRLIPTPNLASCSEGGTGGANVFEQFPTRHFLIRLYLLKRRGVEVETGNNCNALKELKGHMYMSSFQTHQTYIYPAPPQKGVDGFDEANSLEMMMTQE